MPNKTERLAAALLAIKRGDSWLIPEPLRSSGDAEAICAHVSPDHNTPWTWTHDNRPQNITFRARDDHLEKTTKIDAPAIAKVRRNAKKKALTSEQVEMRAKLLAIEGREPPKPQQKRKWGSRKMAGSKDSNYKVCMTKYGRKVVRRRHDDEQQD